MSFTAPPQEVTFDGLLFDMDGTIIDSTAAVVKHWHTIGKEIGVDPEVILQTSHGRRSIDMLKIVAPEKANWEYVQDMEARLPLLHGDSAVEIPGARPLLDSLVSASKPWAIVTSGTVPLVTGWMNRLDLPRPEVLVTAESVAEGKPDPSCYLLGWERLLAKEEEEGRTRQQQGQEEEKLLVLEDSPAGIRAGKAAGCKVIGLVTSHTLEQVVAAEPDWVLRDLTGVRLVVEKSEEGGQRGVTLRIEGALVKEGGGGEDGSASAALAA